MAGPATQDFLAAYDEGHSHIPIRVASLLKDTITGFDLYLQVNPDEPLVLYADRKVTFGEEAQRRLADTGVQHLYVAAEEESEYRQYLELNLPAILSDRSIPVPEKCEILYMSAQGLVKEMLKDPRMGRGIARSTELVRNTVDLLLSQRTALRYLIRTASFDYYTYTHSVNVCVYGVALAQRAGYNVTEVLHEMGNGALLHDVGFGQLDEAATEHTRELSHDESLAMQRHPVLGQELLVEAGGLGKVALDIVRHHHEKLDGSGYPDGLQGDAIGPRVRIATIGDVFDALTTHRPYRKALSSYAALDLMQGEMREKLDRDLLKAFIDMMGHPE